MMKVFFSTCVIAMSLAAAPAFAAHATISDVGDVDLSTTFSVAESTKVPGKTLKAGEYQIRVLDHLADRVLLQIEDSKGKAEAKFLAVPNATLPHGSGAGPIAYTDVKHGSGSLRGFAFPGGSTVEFVYPKSEAAGIAKTSGASVLAIDPASEGRPPANKLSRDDMQVVTLWTLSPTRVGPENASQPAIEAQRYQAPRQSQPVQMASAKEPPPLPPTSQAYVPASSNSSQQAAPQRAARPVKRTAVISSLPHTASNLPAFLLLGFFSLTVAALLRVVRVKFGA